MLIINTLTLLRFLNSLLKQSHFLLQLFSADVFSEWVRHFEVVQEPLLLDGVHRVAVDGDCDGETGPCDDPVLATVFLVTLSSLRILPLGHTNKFHLENVDLRLEPNLKTFR